MAQYINSIILKLWVLWKENYDWIVPAIIAYFSFKANQRSADIASQMSMQEEKRDLEDMKERANKVYFTLLNFLEYLCCHMKESESKKTVYIPDDWICDLAKIKSVLDDKETKAVFDLYRNIIAVNNIVTKEDNNREVYKQVGRWLTISDLLDLYINKQSISQWESTDLLKVEYRHIIAKIKKLSDISSLDDIEKISHEEKDNVIQETDNKGVVKFEITYSNDLIKTIKICDEDGHKIEDGEYVNGYFSGYKEVYNHDKLVEKGMYENNILKNGYRYHVYAGCNYENQYEEEYEEEKEEISNNYDEYFKVIEVRNGEDIENKSYENLEKEYL